MPRFSSMRKHRLVFSSVQKVDGEIYVMTISILYSYARINILCSVICMVFYRFKHFIMIPVDRLAVIYVIAFEIYSIIKIICT